MTTTELTPRDMKNMAADVKKIKDTLYGNGTVGMDEVIRNMQTSIEELRTEFRQYRDEQEKEKEMETKLRRDEIMAVKDKRDKYWYLMISVLISNGVAFIGWLIAWFVKIYPLLEQLQKQAK